jgi:hypothetical protein
MQPMQPVFIAFLFSVGVLGSKGLVVKCVSHCYPFLGYLLANQVLRTPQSRREISASYPI